MNVLVNTPDLSTQGGVAAYFRTLRQFLPRNVVYFAVGPRRPAERGWRRLHRCLSDYIEFFCVVCKGECDLIHLNPSLGSTALIRDGIFLLIAKSLGRKVVVFIHGWNHGCERALRRRWLWLFRRVFFRADAFIVLAVEFREKLTAMGYRGPVYLETTTVDDSVFQHQLSSHTMRRQGLACFNVLFLSRIEASKGIYVALDAYAKLKKRCPQARLVVAGDGSTLEEARSYVKTNAISDVEFTGHVTGDAKVRVFLRSHCYLFPSYYGEGMPTTVLEAMAYGLPVVTRPVGGLRDFFEGGKMGYIADSVAPDVFAGMVQRLMEQPEVAEQTSQYNREYAAKRFRASVVAGRLQTIYASVLSRSERR